MTTNDSLPRLYTELADWWPLFSSPDDYVEEAAFFASVLQTAASAPGTAVTVLELGSGGGNNAFHLKRRFSLTLVDRAPGMLAVSRRLNPECEHVEGDMRSVRLGRRFDAVFIHDAIMYLTTLDDLALAFETARLHLRPGGLLIVAPDCVAETFRPSTSVNGTDGPTHSIRSLEWTWDPDPNDHTAVVDFVHLLRQESGDVRVVPDRHIFGLFRRQQWLETLETAGFIPEILTWIHSEVPDGPLEVFIGHPNVSPFAP